MGKNAGKVYQKKILLGSKVRKDWEKGRGETPSLREETLLENRKKSYHQETKFRCREIKERSTF